MRNVPGLEAIYRDYHPRGVEFFIIYKSIVHPGTNGIPQLTVSGNPMLGTTVDLLVGNAVAQPTQGVVFAGFGRVSVPTPFGGVLLVQPDFDVTFALATGRDAIQTSPRRVAEA